MQLELAARLQDARSRAGMTQSEAAITSGVGEKSISSFETGDRVSTIKLDQLMRLLRAYGMDIADFFREL